MHTLISKTYRPEEEILKYDDVAELAQERLPDRFVSEALGLDLKEHYQQLAVAHERMVG